MSQTLTSLLEVSIDFDQSHLFFPRLVLVMLAGMLLLIAVLNRGRLAEIVRTRGANLAFFEANADKFRLFSTLVLIVVYFVSMDFVGQLFPNTGLGFLLCSIVFVALLSLVYVHEITRSVLLVIGCNALFAPLTVWYVLGSLFDITLP
ncbi:tripartite tricarboxylate transporter TctB family protein [Marinobacterium rhizophilum]|uniref:Tripartite tricarboxylate transporter n=1 Tax=Marinobacterium rhizophilum TaxID=420402 RepID=A0ABY5HJQ3_9GAMM|nr:tripartite tricarboxylate transporter TctB family protein [Marinobacterium rhizophilum]UTW11492.1 tripartite tricarboxylate transporter [Marinobacterium rhizophilum]